MTRLTTWLTGTSPRAEYAMYRVARTAFPSPIQRLMAERLEANRRAARQFHEAMKPLRDALRRMGMEP